MVPVRGFGESVETRNSIMSKFLHAKKQLVSQRGGGKKGGEGTQRCICQRKQHSPRARATPTIIFPRVAVDRYTSIRDVLFNWNVDSLIPWLDARANNHRSDIVSRAGIFYESFFSATIIDETCPELRMRSRSHKKKTCTEVRKRRW